MYSPFVRRLRLAREVRYLRERAELTHPELGKKIGRPRQQISRLETGRWIPKQAEMMKILDELAVRRPTAPPPIMRAQLEHLVESVNGGSQITVRVLPATASIESYTVPRGGYSLYTYADPGDPVVVAVDTITSDLILTDADQVAPHDELYRRLRDAALPAADSLDLLAKSAAALPNE
jgi:transcriptional regulator with XRE-family HTH domain